MKLENSSFSPPHPCLMPPLRGNPSEFLDETYPAKTRGMGLLYGKNCTILTSTIFDWSTRVTDGQSDGQTDGWAMAYTRYSMLSRVKIRKSSYQNFFSLNITKVINNIIIKKGINYLLSDGKSTAISGYYLHPRSVNNRQHSLKLTLKFRYRTFSLKSKKMNFFCHWLAILSCTLRCRTAY